MLKLSIITFSMNPQLAGAFLKLCPLGLNAQEEIGITGMFSQLQSSTMYPSGSWKNTCSTLAPSSSTTAVTYLIPISCSLFITSPTSVHCSKHINIKNWTVQLGYIVPKMEAREPLVQNRWTLDFRLLGADKPRQPPFCGCCNWGNPIIGDWIRIKFCLFLFKFYLEGDVVVLGINWSQFIDGVILIDWWVLN